MQHSSELSNALEHALSSRKAKAEDGKTLSVRPILYGIWRSLWVRALLLLVAYCLILAGSRWAALLLRFESDVPIEHYLVFQQTWLLELGAKLLFLVLFGQLSGLLSYFSVPDLRRLFYGTAAASGVLLMMRYLFPHYYSVPRGYLLIDWLLSFGGLALLRLGFRVVRERYLSPVAPKGSRVKRVGILGAGDVGASLARELMTRRGLHLHPVAFFDDDASKWRSRVHEIPVVGAPEDLLKQELDLQLDQVIIAMPSAPAKRIGEIVRLLQRTRLKFSTVPSVDQLATGVVKVSQLRDVEIQDLLGREPVELETDDIRALLENRVVMVTGAGGSIGSELCRQIAAFNPKRLLLVEQSEVQIFQIEQELIDRGFAGIVLPLVADILDEARMRQILERFHPEIIFHAAAHKHVPMMELQPGEALKNNTFGTVLLADLSAEFGVKGFILISTDKAINPTNVMGASKRMAEVFLQAFAAANPSRTKFIAVRFGNVLGSSGSVIPIFKKQIAAGGPVKVTHPEITRYFMTIPEAAGLVLQAATQGAGGEIFVLDMGKPVKIVDLARQLIELSGLRPDEDIEIQFTGLRPGEKLFEELSYQGENISPTTHAKIMRFVTQPVELATARGFLDTLRKEINSAEPDKLKLRLQQALPEYQPYLT